MKKLLLKKYKNLTALALIVFAAALGLALGVLTAPAAFLIVFFWQFAQFATSKRRGLAFTTVLTPEQVREFEQVVNRCSKFFTDNETLFKDVKDLGAVEGGFAALKKLPDLLKGEVKRVDDLQGDIKKLRKQLALTPGSTGVRWVGNVPFVTDDCARSLSSVFVMETNRLGEQAMRSLNRNPATHTGLMERACEYLGIEAKTAMSGTQVPLPTIYVPQIVELVFAWGTARQRATVFPLGAGTVKLPRLAAGEDDFGYLGVGAAGMSQAVAEKRVTAELVTFTANKAGGLIRLPTELEEDTFIQLGQFLARYIARQMAKLEDRTLFLADGTGTYANQTGVGPYCVANVAYLHQLGAGKTKANDVTLEDLRKLRGKVSAAVLANMAAAGQTSAAYYFHPTMEPLLRSFNKYPNFVVFTNENGKPMFDGWPIVWIGAAAANNDVAAPEEFVAFFGDLSYWYLGERGTVRVEVSKEVFFATDELALRALERIDIQALAIDAMAALQTAGS